MKTEEQKYSNNLNKKKTMKSKILFSLICAIQFNSDGAKSCTF